MPGISSSTERKLRSRRSFRWKVMANRCASSRRRARRCSSLVFWRKTTGFFCPGRKTRSGLRSMSPFTNRPFCRERPRRGGGSGGAEGAVPASPAICGTTGSGPAFSAHASATRKPWRAAKRSSSSRTRLFARPASGTPCSVRPTSFSAARATFSCPFPPSTTSKSGRFCSSMPRLSLRVRTWNMEAKSSPAASPRTLNRR